MVPRVLGSSRTQGSLWHRWLVPVFVLAGFAPGLLGVQDPAADRTLEDAIARARSVGEAAVEQDLPGLSIAVGFDGRIVWAEGFGHADLEQDVPVDPRTRFRIGSVSKPLTGAAVGLLVERGELDLDAPVQQYVPDYPETEHAITTRMAAGHLAGIRHYRGQEFLSNQYYATVTEGLVMFQNDPLLSVPGEKFSYSSYSWNLVSAVIEGAAQQEFLTFMHEQVWAPLRMNDTVADINHEIIPHRARPYVRVQDGTFQNAPTVDNSYKWAGGGFLSTPSDLIRFAHAHLEPGFLADETLELLFEPMQTADGKSTNYGIGWRSGNFRGHATLGHGGGSVGGTTRLSLYPDSAVVVALVSNLSQASLPGPGELDLLFLQ